MFQYYPFRSLFLLAAVTQDILEERCYSFTDTKVIRKRKKKKVISVQSCRDVKGIPDQTLPMVLLVVLTLLD